MTLPKFEDWKRPWGEDDNFDADKAAKLIYNLHVDKDKLQSSNTELTTAKSELEQKVQAFEDEKLSESERKDKEIERLKAAKESPKDDLTAARLEIALEKGLTKKQALRLTGSSREELEQDADAYIEEHNLGGGDGGGSGDEGGQAPPSNRPKADVKVKTGLGGGDSDNESFDPAELAKSVGRF